MAETDTPNPIVEGPKEVSKGRRVSAVWLIPLVALIISLGVAWRNYDGRGPLIEIVFDNAAGIEAGKTAIRFRDVTVGTVEEVHLSSDLQRVVVSARITKNLAQYLDADARFWVVRPSITSQGISGLDTVVSGAYIDAFWNNEPGERQYSFTALPTPPLTPAGQPGTRVRLLAPEGGSLAVGAPVLFKQIQVGRIENIELSEAGDVMIDIFVNAPNNKRLTEGARFWNASGFNISLGPSGAELNVASLLSIVQGGVSFDTVVPDARPVEAGHVFQLYDNERAARRNVIEIETGFHQMLSAYFDGSVQGLTAGAPIEFRGVPVGEVTSVQAVIRDSGGGAPQVAMQATLSILPRRMGIAEGTDAEMSAAFLDLLAAEVSQGLRARLSASGLLGQTLFVDLVTLEDAPPGDFERDAQPFPVIPTAPSDTTALTASAQGLMQRLAGLPIEDMMREVQSLIANVNKVVSSDGVRQAPENLGLLLGDLRQVVADPALQDAPRQLGAILQSAEGIARQLEEERLVDRLGTALDTTNAAVGQIGDAAAAGLPDLMRNLTELSEQAKSLPLADLTARATAILATADGLLAEEGTRELPAALAASLTELRATLAELREGGTVANVNDTLASASEAADALAKATADLPALVAQLNDLARRADTTLSGIGPDSPVNRETLALLRQVNTTAKSIDDLVSALERRPNSLIFGR